MIRSRLRRMFRWFLVWPAVFGLLPFPALVPVVAAEPCRPASQTICASIAEYFPATANTPVGIPVLVAGGSNGLVNAIVDVEIFSASGAKVHQHFFEYQTIAPRETRLYPVRFVPAQAGAYLVKVGVFAPDWSQLYFWTNAAGEISVNDIAGAKPAVSEPSSVAVWWPADGASIGGSQPFKARIDDRELESYQMFWQVDDGAWNVMDSNSIDGPHKETMVDVSNWQWRGSGPYRIRFIAQESNGQRIADTEISILVNAASQTQTPPASSQNNIAPTPVIPAPEAPAPRQEPIPAATAAVRTEAQVDMSVNAGLMHPISPYIYGTNVRSEQSSWDGASRNLTLSRFGGNRLTTYNWENNASNAGSDWQQQNDGYLGGGDTPAGAVASQVRAAHDAGAAALVTVPMQGYVAADKRGDGDVSQSANYLESRFERMLPQKPGPLVLAPNLNDGAVYADEFVHAIETMFPEARTHETRKIFYSLDNEPDLWTGTHPRIQTEPVTYAGLLGKSIAFASAIKNVAPGSMVFGAANYGWNGFETLQNAPDANGRNFLSTYLAAMAAAERGAGKRLLDVMDIHWYPEAQGGGRRIIEDDASPEIAVARMQAPRSLWDSAYRENSWIANDVLRNPIALLPNVKQKIEQFYPGTKLALSEYYYGGGNHISGGIAQADVLGIFGKEDVYAANLWHIGNTDGRFIYGAFAIYRNFDGRGSAFGDQSITAQTSDNERTSIYAATDSRNPNRMTLVAINKTSAPIEASVALSNAEGFVSGRVYQLTDRNAQPVPAGSVSVESGNVVRYTLPAHSVSTMELTK